MSFAQGKWNVVLRVLNHFWGKPLHHFLIVLIIFQAGIVCAVDELPVVKTMQSLKQAIQNGDKDVAGEAILQLSRIKETVPLDAVVHELVSDSQNQQYRRILADLLSYRMKTVSSATFEKSWPALEKMINDPQEDLAIRRYLISAVMKYHLIDKNRRWGCSATLWQLLGNKKEDPAVRNLAMHYLARSADPQVEDYLMETITTWTDQDPAIRASAVRCLGMTGIVKAQPPMLEIIEKTDDKDLFLAAVFALGCLGTTEAVEVIVANFGKYEFEGECITRAALRRAEKRILKMFNSDRDSEVQTAIKAARLINSTKSMSELKRIAARGGETGIQAIEAIRSITYMTRREQ